jgi:hypothetical protein
MASNTFMRVGRPDDVTANTQTRLLMTSVAYRNRLSGVRAITTSCDVSETEIRVPGSSVNVPVEESILNADIV